MRRILRVLLSGLLMVGFAPSMAALTAEVDPPPRSRTFHVDCSARHGGDGLRLPWNSLRAVSAHGRFAPGDRILLRRGSTCRGMLAPAGSGTAARPIVLGAYGGGAAPRVEGGGTPDLTATVSLRNVEHWTVQDLHITNHGRSLRSASGYRSGVAISNIGAGRLLAGIVVQRLRVRYVASSLELRWLKSSRSWGGIAVTTARTASKAPTGFRGLILRDNVVDHVGRTGIIVDNAAWPTGYDDRPRITGNTVSWARSDSIVMRGARSGRIDHNTSADGADMWPCPECGAVASPGHASAAIWTAHSRSVRIDHNAVYRTRARGGDGEAFDADRGSIGAVIEYNYSRANAGGGVLFCGSYGAVARFNVLEGDGRSEFVFIGTYPASRTVIHNNTIYRAKSSGSRIVRYFNGKSGDRVEYYNNLTYTHQQPLYSWPSTVRMRANSRIALGTGRGEAEYRRLKRQVAAMVPVPSKRSLDPLRVRRAPRTGVPVPESVDRDFFGRRFPSRTPPRGAIVRHRG